MSCGSLPMILLMVHKSGDSPGEVWRIQVAFFIGFRDFYRW